MQRPIDLLTLRNAIGACPAEQKRSFFPVYERVLSHRHTPLQYKAEEVGSLVRFVDGALAHGLVASDLDGFAYSYAIPHISKEFDLLKVGEECVLDVELKSRRVSPEDACRQLRRNDYYLSFLGLEVVALSFCSDEDSWHLLVDNEIEPVDWDDVVSIIRSLGECEVDIELDTLFVPANYMVSPVMDVERFLEGRYFLTNQQEQIKHHVVRQLGEEGSHGFMVRGEAGTGKSLLLYDIARTLSEQSSLPAAIVHGAPLSEYHHNFNYMDCGVEVLDTATLGDADLGRFCFVGFDEPHRMDIELFAQVMSEVHGLRLPFVVMVDARHELTGHGHGCVVEELTHALVPPQNRFELTKRLRTNSDTAWFIDAFVLGKRGSYRSAKGVEVSYVSTDEGVRELVDRYVEHGYQHIAIPIKDDVTDGLRALAASVFPTTHDVVGLEYDAVVMVVPASIHLQDGRLCDSGDQDADLQPTKLLYQGLSRARDRIALVFRYDWEVFRRAVELLDEANK